MKRFFLVLLTLAFFSNGFSTQYYSRQDGDFDNASTWSTESSTGPAAAASPGKSDTLYIYHHVTHKLTGTYQHSGDITIMKNAYYEIKRKSGGAKKYYFIGSRMDIMGALSTDGDFYHGRKNSSDNGHISMHSTSTVDIGDDFILQAHTTVDVNSSDCNNAGTLDDIYLIGSHARICGSGSFIVPDKIRAWGDTGSEITGSSRETVVAQQVCSGFSIYESVSDCDLNIPKLVGTGEFTLAVEQEAESTPVEEISTVKEIQSRFIQAGNVSQALLISGLQPIEHAEIKIMDLTGRILSTHRVSSGQDGEITLNEQVAWMSQSGIIILQLSGAESGFYSKKHMVL